MKARNSFSGCAGLIARLANIPFCAGVATVLIASVVAGPRRAVACSCVTPTSPCASIGSSAQVFLGVVESVTLAPQGDAGFDRGPVAAQTLPAQASVVQVRFQVNEVLNGTLVNAKSVTVVTDRSTPGSCGFPFEIGVSYLVYAGGPAERLGTSSCTRTGREVERQLDLELLRETKAGVTRTRLHGMLFRMGLAVDSSFMHLGPIATIASAAVTATGSDGSHHEAVTDARGEFRFIGLRPDTYTLSPAVGPGLSLRFPSLATVTLDTCIAEAFLGVTSTILSGRVFAPDGSPAKDVPVTVARVDEVSGPPAYERSTVEFTDDHGDWTFQGLPAGRYLVGVNLFSGPTKDSPYEVQWFPSAPTAASAEILALSDSAPRRIEIRLAAASAVAFRGRVVDAAGAPVARAVVMLYDRDGRGSDAAARVDVAADGTFTVSGFARRRYAIGAMVYRMPPARPVDLKRLDIPSNQGDEPLVLRLEP